MICEKWLLKVICLQNLNDRLKETQKEVFNGKERERKREREREREREKACFKNCQFLCVKILDEERLRKI